MVKFSTSCLSNGGFTTIKTQKTPCPAAQWRRPRDRVPTVRPFRCTESTRWPQVFVLRSLSLLKFSCYFVLNRYFVILLMYIFVILILNRLWRLMFFVDVFWCFLYFSCLSKWMFQLILLFRSTFWWCLYQTSIICVSALFDLFNLMNNNYLRQPSGFSGVKNIDQLLIFLV